MIRVLSSCYQDDLVPVCLPAPPSSCCQGDLAKLRNAIDSSRGTLLCLDEEGLVLTRIW